MNSSEALRQFRRYTSTVIVSRCPVDGTYTVTLYDDQDMEIATLVTARGQSREFSSLDTVSNLLLEHGYSSFQVV